MIMEILQGAEIGVSIIMKGFGLYQTYSKAEVKKNRKLK